ncbi:6114_t:CDS:2, partial [Cetraspora pellucida]
MSPIPDLLEQDIIKTKEKINKSNHKVYCKAYINILGDDGMEVFVLNKMDRIIAHLKKCTYFIEQTTSEKREKVFNLSNDEQSSSYDTMFTLLQSFTQKGIVQFTSFGPLDNYSVYSFSQQDYEKFKVLLLRLTLPDRQTLSEPTLEVAVSNMIEECLKLFKKIQLLQKAFNISKLKASITWEYSHKSDPVELPLPSFQDKYNTENNDQPNINYEKLNAWIKISKNEIDKIAQIYKDENEMLTSEIEDI